MKTNLVCWFVIAGATTIMLSGCGKSSSSTESTPPTAATPAPAQPAAPAAPAVQNPPAAPATTPAPVMETAPAAAPPANTAAAVTGQETSSVAAATAQLATTAKSQSDSVLSSLGAELAQKVNALSQAAPANTALNSNLSSSVQSLAAGKDASALSSFYQSAKGASLTPQQTELAKEVGNVASAYVVQRNFSNLEGAQGDVATLVNSLRKGELAATLPPLQKIAQNANLTAQQKDLIGSIADKYAPGVSKAAGTLNQGLQSLRNLGK